MKARVHFEAQGRSYASRGFSLRLARSMANLNVAPDFAWEAFTIGYYKQLSTRTDTPAQQPDSTR